MPTRAASRFGFFQLFLRCSIAHLQGRLVSAQQRNCIYADALWIPKCFATDLIFIVTVFKGIAEFEKADKEGCADCWPIGDRVRLR